MNIKTLLTAAAFLAPVSAFAGPNGSGLPGVDLSGFVGYNFVEFGDGFETVEPEGVDLGLRGKVFLGNSGLFLGGEYTYSDTDTQFLGSKLTYEGSEFRLGGGMLIPVTPVFRLGGYGHYVNQEVDTRFEGLTTTGEASGYDVGALIEYDAAPGVQTYGRIGYMNLSPEGSDDDEARVDGVDLLAGLSFKMSRNLSLFGEYRYTHLENDFSEQDYSSVRGGVRLTY